MQETNDDRSGLTDPLAEIVRAAGQRPAPPAEHYDQVFAATRAVWQRRVRARRRTPWYALAAALALAAAGAALWQTLSTPAAGIAASIEIAHGRVEQYLPQEQRWSAVAGGDLSAGTRVRTGSDGAIAVRLPGGGSLRLDRETDVVVDAGSLELRGGTLYFDSAGRRPDRPIDVATPLGTVRDIGTQFEVRTSQTSLRVRVRSGSVAVVDSPAAQPLASPSGEEISVSDAGAVTRRSFAPDDPQWRWAEALAVPPDFDTPSVFAWLSWIAAETGKQLQFTSESVRLRAEVSRFLGDPEGLGPAELLVTIAATTDFSYELTDAGGILISRDD